MTDIMYYETQELRKLRKAGSGYDEKRRKNRPLR